MAGRPVTPRQHNHPDIYPLALARDHIATWANPGELVLAPMVGSGTTLRAATGCGSPRALGLRYTSRTIELILQRVLQQELI